ncbi:MAG: hypothetical protein HY670_00155 [Chloroflexi bacterium]|nr:hypothetical protein [Chloroflexota bacterium]
MLNGGWAGTTLEVDLSTGKIERRELEPALAAGYLGGKGTNARLLWERVPPEVGAFSPENLFIIGAGVLTGTLVPGANRTCITYKSPVTGIHCYSSLGGFFGTELKRAGYDTVVITGKAPSPVYLWIEDDRVAIREAKHLWGKDTRETQEILHRELKTNSSQIMCIGLAGENKVFGASVEHAIGASASRGGSGAVMGDKNLKAVVVSGTRDVRIANPVRLFDLCQHIINRTEKTRKDVFEKTAYAVAQFLLRIGAFGNWAATIPPELQAEINGSGDKLQKFIDRAKGRDVGCANCVLRCRQSYPNADGSHSFFKCQSWNSLMTATQIIDGDFAVAAKNMCEKYGLDVSTMANLIGFATDLYQRGILTREDTDGLHLEPKNAELAFTLIDKIARREGFGDVLANGVYRAAKQIGRGAEEFAYTSKKLEKDVSMNVMQVPRMALITAMNDKGDASRLDNITYSQVFPRSRAEKEAYLKEGWFGYPPEFEKYLLADFEPAAAKDYEWLGQFAAYDLAQYSLADSLGICWYWLQFWRYPAINSRALLADLVATTTGMDIDEAGATEIARRIVNLVRGYNVREGLRRKDDKVPEFAFTRPPPPARPYPILDRALFNKWLDRYYEIEGWTSDGIPTGETLDSLGLDYIRQDLEQRGILATER